jgi:hypothetical protein
LRRLEIMGVYVVLLLMGGPLRRSLKIGAMLGVVTFQCDLKDPQGMGSEGHWTVIRLQ